MRRMRYILRALLPGALGFAVAVLVAACGGSSGLLSADQATSLDGQLNNIANAINAHQCSSAATAAEDFDNAVSNLSGVNHTLTNNLKQASSVLASQAETDCQKAQTTTVVKKPKTKTVTTPTNTVTTPTNTVTTPTSTSPATTGATSTSPTFPATSTTGPGTTTTGGSGGAGLSGTGTSGTGTGGSGGAPAAGGAGNGNGNGNGQ
jgi:hypothetical protein